MKILKKSKLNQTSNTMQPKEIFGKISTTTELIIVVLGIHANNKLYKNVKKINSQEHKIIY